MPDADGRRPSRRPCQAFGTPQKSRKNSAAKISIFKLSGGVSGTICDHFARPGRTESVATYLAPSWCEVALILYKEAPGSIRISISNPHPFPRDVGLAATQRRYTTAPLLTPKYARNELDSVSPAAYSVTSMQEVQTLHVGMSLCCDTLGCTTQSVCKSYTRQPHLLGPNR